MKELKNNRFNLILCAFSLVFLCLYLGLVDGVSNIVTVIKTVNVFWIFIGVACMVVYWILEAMILHLALKKLHPQQKFFETVKVSMIGQYFNCITPFASGGQPVQAYFLVKTGTPLGSAITALLSKFIVFQIALTVFSLSVLILKFRFFVHELRYLMIAVVVGFLVNGFVIAILVSVAYFKRGTMKCSFGIIDILHKLKFVKNPTEKKMYISRELEKFYENFVFIQKNKRMLLRMLLLSLVQLTVYFLIGYVIYLGFGLGGADPVTLISAQAFVLMISSFVPTPGAMGAAEGSSYAFFKLFFHKEQIAFAIVLWRLLTFYLPIVVGLIFTLLEKRNAPSDAVSIGSVEQEKTLE